jgi:hypothetical protein
MQFIRVYLFVFVNIDLMLVNIWSKLVVIVRNKNNDFVIICVTSLRVVDG